MFKMIVSLFLLSISSYALADCFIEIHRHSDEGKDTYQIIRLPDHFCNGPYYQLIDVYPEYTPHEEYIED